MAGALLPARAATPSSRRRWGPSGGVQAECAPQHPKRGRVGRQSTGPPRRACAPPLP